MDKGIKTLSIRSLAIFLSIVMILTALPLYAFAVTIDTDTKESISESVPESTEYDRKKDIFELEDRREETVKHFRLEDGSYIAAQYDVPVHYIDENGEWQDIDNTLVLCGNEYATGNSKIKFAKKITGNESLFALHNGNHKITMNLDGAIKKTTGRVTNSDEELSNATKLQKMLALSGLTSEIIYENILPNVDLQYVINSGNIKENIIVKCIQNSYNYSFTLKLNNLQAQKAEDGSISIYDPATNEVIYLIPAPIVYDAEGEYAPASCSEYTLTQGDNGAYSLTVSVDPTWMNSGERIFPVTIDPPIYVPSGSTVIDTYINSYSPSSTAASLDYLYAGNTTQLYWKTSSLPSLPNDAYITNADFALRILAVYSGTYDSYMGSFQVTTNWNGNLTWNAYDSNDPQGSYYFDDYTDFNVVSVVNDLTDSTWLTWNVTQIVKNWYQGQANYGIVISDINRGLEGYPARNIQFASNEYYLTARLRPKFCISYEDMKGVEDYWTTTSQNAGIAGSGHVNNATGDLSFMIGTLSTTDSLMPYTPTLTYNAAIADYSNKFSNAEVPYINSTAGYGFKWSMSESMVEREYISENEDDVIYYVWSDADGTEHYFTPKVNANGSTVYKDEDGLQMTLEATDSSYTITDSAHTVRTFTRATTDSAYMKAGGVLSTITDASGNKISFSPNTWGRNPTISLIPYGNSSITSFKIIHNASGKVNRILNESSQEAAIFYYSEAYNGTNISPYNGGYLRKIVYAHQTGSTLVDNWADFMENGSNSYITVDSMATYSYDSTGRLIKARDELSKYEVNYAYTNGKVTSITEKAGASTLTTGQQIKLSYYNNYTEVRTSGKDDIINTSNDIITRYVFDNSGRTITAYSMDVNGTTIYGASGGQFNNDEESKNSIRVSSYVSDSAANYIMNGGFENSTALNYWYTTGTVSRTAAAKYAGKYGATISATSGQTSSIRQYAKLTKGAYTLSLNINTNNCSGATVKLIAKSASNTFTEVVPVDEYAASGAYAFASLNFDVTANSENYQIIIQITGANSTAQSIMVDNVMLAKSVGVSAYNMVELGNFEDCCLNASGLVRVTPEIRWTRSDTTNVTVTAPDVEAARFGESLKIVGHLDSARNASLNVFNATSSTDLNTPKIYKVSGFAKSDMQMSNIKSKFAIKVDVVYYDQTKNETFWFDFAKTTANQWQFTSGTFDVCTDGGAVKTIKVSCVYDYQSGRGTAYFDNISVVEVRDGSAESYTYYDSGMPKTYDNGNYKEWYFYADNNTSTNLIKKITSTKGITEYTYDSKNRVTQEVYYEYTGTYTGSESSITKTPRTKTTYVYNSFGLLTNTTTRTVRYSGSSLVDTVPANVISSNKTYNVSSGLRIFGSLATETDTLGQITRYFYDSKTGLLTAVVNPDNNGTVYTYDHLGNLTLVEPATYSSSGVSAVTNAESAEYTYTNGRLDMISTESSTYEFEYDVFGNNQRIGVGNRTLANYTYNTRNGKLSTITYGNGFVVNYVYDELDRIKNVKYNNSVVFEYEYDANGNLCKMNDLLNDRMYQYKYDDQGRLTGYYESVNNTNVSSTVTVYDDQSRLHTISHSIDYVLSSSSSNLNTKYRYSYTDSGKVSGLTMSSGNVSYSYTPTYDALDRVSSSTTTFNSPDDTFSATFTYDYTVGSNNNESLQVSGLSSQFGSYNTSYTYEYDAKGNITKIHLSNGAEYRYVYDDLGQLIREDNTVLNKTYVYTYDNAGNILSKKTYTLTAAGSTPTSLQSTNTYGYTDPSWGDLLTSFNGQAITYDGIGNPLSYNNGSAYTFTWENGRQLSSATKGRTNVSYTYNDEGIRTEKTVNGTKHIYYLSGSQILAEEVDSVIYIYLYDENGSPIGMQTRSSTMAEDEFYTFWFEKNLQGDIIAVYNDLGQKVCSYTYDAWGNCTSTLYTVGVWTAIVHNNPFRYRGYYLDAETGLYYLNSRYYDPNTGRFINADGYVNSNGDILGFNMFAYCGNNPVMGYDPTGEFSFGKLFSGAKLLAIGITACATALTVISGGACAPLMAVAIVTLAAGAATVVNGASEVVESATNYNFVRDTVLGGNEKLYETQKNILTTTAEVGTAVLNIAQMSNMSFCFEEGTPVAVEGGTIPIDSVTVGMMVWATDEETGETALKKVVQIFRNETEEWVHVTVNGEKITCTPNHPFYSPVKGWTAAVDLRAGDILVMLNGEYVVLEQVQHELLESPVATYNFEVEDFHTYYVGEESVLVHNKCGSEHGNSLKTTKPAEGYVLKENGTNRVLKFGETTRGAKRYSQTYLNKNNAYIDFVKKGTKAEMHTWQHDMITNYFNRHGVLPPLNKSFW